VSEFYGGSGADVYYNAFKRGVGSVVTRLVLVVGFSVVLRGEGLALECKHLLLSGACAKMGCRSDHLIKMFV